MNFGLQYYKGIPLNYSYLTQDSFEVGDSYVSNNTNPILSEFKPQ